MISAGRIAEITAALQPLGPVEVRRMFGGAGVYLDGRIFAILSDDALYAKVDGESEGRFEAAGCPRFAPEMGGGRAARMPYRRLPEEAQRPGAAMLEWAQLGVEAAARAPAKRKPSKPAGRASVTAKRAR